MPLIFNLIISFLIFPSLIFGQSEKPQTIVVPTGSLGEISEVRNKMLEMILISNLDDHFDIVPEDLFEEAQEKAFEELDYEECTEEQCIMMIKEILQVENSFQLVLMVEEGNTLISLIWNDLDKKRVEEEYCEGCKTKELRKSVSSLVNKLVGTESIISDKKEIVEKEESKAETYPKKQLKPILEKSGSTLKNNNDLKLYTENYKLNDMILKYHKLYLTYLNGKRTWLKNNNDAIAVYVGEAYELTPNGYGNILYHQNIFYSGEFKNGVKYGNGIMINNQNEIKVGYFEKYFKKGIIVSKNNKINNFNNKKGIGYLSNYNGKTYKGHIKTSQPNGLGILINNKSRQLEYIGSFNNGKYDGYGINYKNNFSFIGEWIKNNKWNISQLDKNNKIINYWHKGRKVTDVVMTMQKKNSSQETIVDSSSGLMWQKKPDGYERNWKNAKLYCDSLVLEGFNNWELPSQPVLNMMLGKKDIFDEYKKDGWYWTSTLNSKITFNRSAAMIGFKSKYNGFSPIKDKYRVICVRKMKE